MGTSLLLQQPEPCTVTCLSPQVKLLRADNISQSKFTPKVLEALKEALKQKGCWLQQRLETLAKLPLRLRCKAPWRGERSSPAIFFSGAVGIG
ncbi:unnamed protein product [Effrenium voratum]|nr:unnamed protein product [Effrenium voratum]